MQGFTKRSNLIGGHDLITQQLAPCRYPLFPSQVYPCARRPNGHRKGSALAGSQAQVCLDKGVLLYSQGQRHEALWAFFEGVASSPQNPMAHYLCGLGLQALGLEAEARAEWELVLTLTVPKAALLMEPVETNWSRGLALYLVSRA